MAVHTKGRVARVTRPSVPWPVPGPRVLCPDSCYLFPLGPRRPPLDPLRAAARAWLLVSVAATSPSATPAVRLDRNRSAAALRRPPTLFDFAVLSSFSSLAALAFGSNSNPSHSTRE